MEEVVQQLGVEGLVKAEVDRVEQEVVVWG